MSDDFMTSTPIYAELLAEQPATTAPTGRHITAGVVALVAAAVLVVLVLLAVTR